MKIVAVARVKNEADVIEEFVRHTLRFVDSLVVIDNASFDSTGDILRALKDEGLPLEITSDDILAYQQSAIMTKHVRRLFEETQADYILLLDADEFLKTGSRQQLEGSLAKLRVGMHGLMPWMTYIPRPDADLREPRVLVRLPYRRRTESRQYYKVAVSRFFLQQPNAVIAQGNHAVSDQEISMESPMLDGVCIAHFPVRSIPQTQCKALLGWSAIMAMEADRPSGISYQWRVIYEKLTKKVEWTGEDLFQYALHYLDDARGPTPELQYDPLQPVVTWYPHEPPNLLSAAIAYTRQLAVLHAQLTDENDKLRRMLDQAAEA